MEYYFIGILYDLGFTDAHLCRTDICGWCFPCRLVSTEDAPLIFVAVTLALLVRRHAVAHPFTHPTDADLYAASTTVVVTRPVQRIVLAVILFVAEQPDPDVRRGNIETRCVDA